MMSVSIRTRLLLLMAAVLLPAVSAALWVIGRTWLDERHALEGHLRDSARALSTVVDQELTHRAVIARVLALSRMLDAAPQVPPEQMLLFAQQARRAMQGLGGWIEVHSPTLLLLDTRRDEEGAALPSYQAHPQGLRPLLPRPEVGALRAGSDGVLRAAIVQPVERGGKPLLNLVVTILPQELQALIDRQRLPPDWVAAVVDKEGTLVARHPGGVRHAGRDLPASVRRQLALGSEGLFRTLDLDGRPVLAYFSTSPQGWTYVTAVPRDALAGWNTGAVLPVVLGALALLALGAGGALWVARRIAGPVEALGAAAAALQAGEPVDARSTGIAECDAVVAALVRADESLRRSRAELQRRVEEAVARTREGEQRVAQSQRAEALGRLTGGVAHDFNNLLGVISNSAHLIRRRSEAAFDRAALALPVAAILRSVEIGSRLTQHLMRFAGRQPVRPQRVWPAAYLPEAAELLRTVLGKQVVIEVAVAPDTPALRVDAAELELALINMALNARDAMDGRGHVWLRARRAEPQEQIELGLGDFVLLSFADDGCGVAEGLTEKVFEPFFTTKAQGRGTGLGLSQVHGFCTQAGGTARLASTPGLGTTVSLLLPADAGTEPPIEAQPPAAPMGGLEGARVLLVEDNEELGRVTASLLASFGCRVRHARGADEALALVGPGQEPVDVVLSDVAMPGAMDGLALARALRRRDPALPVVLISGYHGSALRAAPQFPVLPKPCAPAELLAALRRAMAREAG
ncbi:response regulator [Roseateles sp. DAIF2]|uniref:ATP-binding protein n=1 Tax=Roseateles sp. DAIF2 TaxID=2714952 RepID=UPI0018A28EC6|nr:ATP-binding protein [Roseateles sp. DAIF2]QPF74142.1 response regulator [Roseateles sp. DAIF2]